MTLLTQLQEKHFNAIFDNVDEDHGEMVGHTEASTSCAQISIAAIVEVLEGCKEDTPLQTERNIYNIINELKALLK